MKHIEPDHDHGLEFLVSRARRRVSEAVPHSPEWAAAIEGLEELERLNLRVRKPVLTGDVG